MSKQKLRNDNIVICPYADYKEHTCSHPRCIRMHGQHCYLKKDGRIYGKKNKLKKHISRHSRKYEL